MYARIELMMILVQCCVNLSRLTAIILPGQVTVQGTRIEEGRLDRAARFCSFRHRGFPWLCRQGREPYLKYRDRHETSHSPVSRMSRNRRPLTDSITDSRTMKPSKKAFVAHVLSVYLLVNHDMAHLSIAASHAFCNLSYFWSLPILLPAFDLILP
jgi:hypothetical protein